MNANRQIVVVSIFPGLLPYTDYEMQEIAINDRSERCAD